MYHSLLESDYNQSQRILLARPLSQHLEDNKMLHDMQHGSRPGRECISPDLNKVITSDLILQAKTSGAFIENDATGCYDRLVNTIVFLEHWHLGVAPMIIQSIKHSWEQATHHIKTAYGYSTHT